MLDKKKIFEQGQAMLNSEFPKNSELAKYLEQYPDAKITSSNFGWTTELPEEAYPELKLPYQRIHLWNKDGKEGPHLKDAQRER